ncbi:hypothetical protein ISN45_At05g018270 [Arabidopsis thaliana x Arabidopsis arenosa]|uniref:Uncharacterized protein n=1 Tax=Arabidopsis thaliana x Arabidopsis arenosa TaxID=1240361 RepID=A0A8T2CTC2_9BRAS|nr:hypothetical protein ISN45_At05g018270 [Arabidopsis thaliana x Arabidopsis arenosa]
MLLVVMERYVIDGRLDEQRVRDFGLWWRSLGE